MNTQQNKGGAILALNALITGSMAFCMYKLVQHEMKKSIWNEDGYGTELKIKLTRTNSGEVVTFICCLYISSKIMNVVTSEGTIMAGNSYRLGGELLRGKQIS